MLLDAALLALLAAASAAGALAGLVRPAFLFAGAALGWLAARSLSPAVGRMLVAVVPEAASRPAAAVLLLVAVSGAVAVVGWG
ncbi:MAG TPA: CvpA family protein, partial [Anaeromyxobacteraceae bacterium]|nr:CvpA family protein [Anaeromyxobacteraceae bacterium]